MSLSKAIKHRRALQNAQIVATLMIPFTTRRRVEARKNQVTRERERKREREAIKTHPILLFRRQFDTQSGSVEETKFLLFKK